MKRVYHMNIVHVYEFGDIDVFFVLFLYLFCLYLFCVENSKTCSLWLTNKPFDLT